MLEGDFHEVADEFIHLANDLSEDWAPNMLSAVFLYAASRYNAFHFMDTDGDVANEEKAVAYYTEQYRRMLIENLQELRSGVVHE